MISRTLTYDGRFETPIEALICNKYNAVTSSCNEYNTPVIEFKHPIELASIYIK